MRNRSIILLSMMLSTSITLVAQNVILVQDINSGVSSSSPSELFIFNGKLYFSADNGTNGAELWEYDGINSASMTQDINSGADESSIRGFAEFNGKLYFSADNGTHGIELWEYDGINSASMTQDINPGADGSFPLYLTIFNGKLHFSASDDNQLGELWEYDGVNSASMTQTIHSGSGTALVSYLTAFNGILYFLASNGTSGYELWEYDGMNASLTQDINPGPSNSSPVQFTIFNNKMYFNAALAGHGFELWEYDGVNSASMTQDINPGAGWGRPGDFIVFNSKLFFRADDGSHGFELWEYDGVNSASMTQDINPGAGDSSPAGLIIFNSKLYFSASNGANGIELWEYDGANSASMTWDINPGANDSEPEFFQVFNSKLYFSADNGVNGKELFVFDPNAVPPSAPELSAILASEVTVASTSISVDIFDGGVTTTYTFHSGTQTSVYDIEIADASQTLSGSSATTNVGTNLTGLTINTKYFSVVVATNSVGSATTTESTFWTILEPESHSSSLSLRQAFNNDLVFEFNSATTTGAEGYLLLYKTGGDVGDFPIDFTNYTQGTTIGASTVAAVITDVNQTSATISNLTRETFYSVALVPFNWDGSTGDSKNYKIDGDVASLTVSTIPILGEWGLLALVSFISICGIMLIRKQNYKLVK